jgi:multifunctional beta-oxidation protein
VTATVMPPEVLENLKPEHVAPVVAWLCHESCKESGQLYETGAGWTGQVRWELSKGAIFKPDDSFTPSAVGRPDLSLYRAC